MAIISESTYQDFELLFSKEVIRDLSDIGNANECEFEVPVFAYPSDTADKYRNDFTTSLLPLTNRYSTPEFYLEVETSCDNWTQVAQLNDNTYGTFYSTFDSKPLWSGYKINWWKVYNTDGVGCYRIRREFTDITDATVKVVYSYKYNLKLWNENLADKTTKIRTKTNGGKTGNKDFDKNVLDYKEVIWEREIRLPKSFFGFESSEFTREYTRYSNGGQVHIEDSQKETILFNAKKLPYFLHRELKIDYLQADEIYLSDYNLQNPNPEMYDNKRVIVNSAYEPKWNLYNSYASIELQFNPYYENLRRKQC